MWVKGQKGGVLLSSFISCVDFKMKALVADG